MEKLDKSPRGQCALGYCVVLSDVFEIKIEAL